MRVILDTNVLVTALRSEMGASYAIVAQLPSERFQMALFSDGIEGALIPAVSGRAHTARTHDRRQYPRRYSQFLTLPVQHRTPTARLLSVAPLAQRSPG